jgi:hypothetical protein
MSQGNKGGTCDTLEPRDWRDPLNNRNRGEVLASKDTECGMELYTNGNVQVGGGPDGHYGQYEQDAREGTNPGVVDPVQSSWLHFGLLDHGQVQVTVPSRCEFIKEL